MPDTFVDLIFFFFFKEKSFKPSLKSGPSQHVESVDNGSDTWVFIWISTRIRSNRICCTVRLSTEFLFQ